MSDTDTATPMTAGRLLREARQGQGLHIAALASAIKVAPRKLELLESDRLDELPDPAFSRALAQTVCRSLKIDPAPILALLPQPNGHRLAQVGEGLNAPFRERPGRLEPSEWASLRNPAIWAPLLVLLAAGAIYLMPSGWLPSGGSRQRAASGAEGEAGRDATTGMPAGANAASSPAAGHEPLSVAASASAVMPGETVGGGTETGDAASPSGPGSPASAGSDSPSESGMSGSASAPRRAATSPVLPQQSAPSSLNSPAAGGSASAATSSGGQTLGAPGTTPAPGTRGAATQAGTAGGVGANATAAADGPSGLLQLRTSADSWVEVVDASGRTLLSRLVKGGEALGLDGTPPLKLKIGNAESTAVVYRGAPLELAPYTRDNLARLELR